MCQSPYQTKTARSRREIRPWARLELLMASPRQMMNPESLPISGCKVGRVSRWKPKTALPSCRGQIYANGSACHLLGQRIVARGRIVLLEMMERILDCSPDVEICYTNINFASHFSNFNQASRTSTYMAEIRMFRIRWVLSRSRLSGTVYGWSLAVTGSTPMMSRSSRNRSVGDRQQPFKDHAVHVVSRQLGELHVPIRATLRMERTMSPLRS